MIIGLFILIMLFVGAADKLADRGMEKSGWACIMLSLLVFPIACLIIRHASLARVLAVLVLTAVSGIISYFGFKHNGHAKSHYKSEIKSLIACFACSIVIYLLSVG